LVIAGADFDKESGSRPRLSIPLAFTRPDTHPLVLDRLLSDQYGVTWMTWEPETLWATITKTFCLKTEISKHARSGIQAVKTVHANDQFYQSYQTTYVCTQALAGDPPDFEVLRPIPPGYIIHAVECAELLRGSVPYDSEVQRWMASCFLYFGLLFAPEPVEFIQDNIAQQEAVCGHCGNVEWADGLTECPSCGKEDKLLRRAKLYWQDVRTRWQIVRNMEPSQVTLREDRIGVQLARTLVAKQFARDRLEEMEQQLRDLGYDSR